MKPVYIVDALRTPIGKYGGALSSVRPDDLAAIVIRRIIERNSAIDPTAYDEVIFGCANQAGEDNRNVARMSSLLAGLPASVPAETVNRLCASGMSAVANAANKIRVGDGDLYIAGGVESMSRAPYVMAKPSEAFSRAPEMVDTALGWRFANPKMKELYGVDSMGQTAENVAEQYGISREDQDMFAYWSQQKAKHSISSQRFFREIITIEIQTKKETIVIGDDEFPKPDTTMEKLAKLNPVFRTDGKGSVTAGNSSGLNDGACALILASEESVKKYGLHPIARYSTSAVVGVEPRVMGIGPLPATKKVLAKAGLTIADMSVIEMNEAFAVQCLAVMRGLGLPDNDSRVNPNGGAIALGHPLGMSGARLITTSAFELQEHGGKYALCTMCIGVGQGMAVIIEKI
ncbi:MAG: 3-oxoadipyl-CoA thiolase [Bacteroidetes bacterium]|nr:3-oxoadipyl-CoA thiolase [Bacteroidota bacterium]